MTQIARTEGKSFNDPHNISQSTAPQSIASQSIASQSTAPQPTESLTTDEKFELLSAYMDNEVTEQERHLVEQWLTCDVQIQRQYQAQLKLSLTIKTLSSDLLPNTLPDTKNASPTDHPPQSRYMRSQEGLSYEHSSADMKAQALPFGRTAFS